MIKINIKQLIHAHSWLGLIISGLLFVVFFTGSISLFRDEINLWSILPHYGISPEVSQQQDWLSPSEIMQIAIEGRDFNAKEHLTLVLPTQERPFYLAYVDVMQEVDGKDYVQLLIDPVAGKLVANAEQFFLADFLYFLHYKLNLPGGKYLIGFVTLFFMFALFSGIVIHAPKLFKHFFNYRSDQTKRTKLLDMHNVIGVMSLPYTLMYAISGLIFNLVIIYQIAFALVLYKGDQDALLKDAGFHIVKPEWQNKPWNEQQALTNIDSLVANAAEQYQQMPKYIRMYNYGDESAVVHMRGPVGDSMVKEYELGYQATNSQALFASYPGQDNSVTQGLHLIAELHFGSFAGVDLRVVYFILGLGVCGLILTGNLMWLDKQAKLREGKAEVGSRGLMLVNAYSIISTAGVALAVSFSFIAERLLPVELTSRADYLVYAFVLGLIVSAIAFMLIKQKRQLIGYLLMTSASLFGFVILLDWLLFADALMNLIAAGEYSILGFEIGLFISALVMFIVGRSLVTTAQNMQNVYQYSELETAQ